MKKSGKYETPAIIFSIFGILLCIVELFTITNVLHLVDFVWFLVIILFTYFTLGKIWGQISLYLLLAALCVFIYLGLNKNIEEVGTLDQTDLAALVANAILGFMIIAYIIHQFIRTNAYAESKYHEVNQSLQDQNTVIKSKNEENIVMLKEIHHRVKNNLQVITSLLRLHSRELSNEESKAHFQDAINRIVAMSLIHEKMYQDDLSKIDINNYFKSLSDAIIDTYSTDAEISTNINIDIESIGLKTIVPLALIYNELFTNSVKYAFVKHAYGKISFSGEIMEDGFLKFTYSDNGTWKETRKESSFGLELIETLTEQLEGNVSRKVLSGTHYYLTIKNLDQ